MEDRFKYQTEKLRTARRCLMLPFLHGEEDALVYAFQECALALIRFDINDISNIDARTWAWKIQELMETEGLQDDAGRGLYRVRAEQMTFDERMEFSRCVDELANWFNMNFWSN